MKNRGIFNSIVILLLICVSVGTMFLSDDTFAVTVSTFSTLLGIFGILYNMYLERQVTEASFLLDLFKSFRENERIHRVGQKLESVFLGRDNKINEDDRGDIVEYLTFFEMVASMYAKGAISLKTLDPLFGYDFFLAMNQENIRNIELVRYKGYYTQIYFIYPEWLKYRKKKGLPIPFPDSTPI